MKKSTTFGYPFISQLGQGCNKTFLLGLLHILSYIIYELPSYNKLKKGYILLRGLKYVAWYIQFTTQHNNLKRPLILIRSDQRKSAIITFLNFAYNGATDSNFPQYEVTSGHQTRGEWPKNYGSMHLLILRTKSLVKRGCSCKLWKKRTQLFQQSNYKCVLFVAIYNKLTRVSTGAVFKAQRSILRKNDSARIKTYAPPYNHMRAVLRHPKMTLPYNRVVTAIAYIN